MRQARPLATMFGALAMVLLVNASISAEEGMWTFDNFPVARANQALGTRIDQAWLDRVRLSSVRFGGCSAGIVSADGLVMTNNHCVATCVANLSTPAVNYAETGFAPRRREDEVQCPGGLAEVLLSIADMTPRMQAAIGTLTGQAFTVARDAEAGRIESEICAGDATRRCVVVSLYSGKQFKVYVYRLYTDVRLAFAPEDRAATFGGDPDNFNFPRFAVDAAFIRLYENGRPVATPVYFRWNASRLRARRSSSNARFEQPAPTFKHQWLQAQKPHLLGIFLAHQHALGDFHPPSSASLSLLDIPGRTLVAHLGQDCRCRRDEDQQWHPPGDTPKNGNR